MVTLMPFTASAETEYTEGDYTYTVTDGKATITYVDESISGDVVIPSTLGGYSVTTISEYSFFDCDSLTSIEIPDSVTSIGDYSFYGCDSLTSIEISDSVTSIAAHSFGWCNNLESIIVDENNPVYHSAGNCIIETESKTLMQGCKNSIIPTDGSVTSIGYAAFSDCTSLKSIDIPASVMSIGKGTFSGCANLESIIVDENNPVYHSAGNCIIETESKTLMQGCKNSIIPTDGSVTSIGEYAFSYCTSLESIDIPASVTSIGEYAFLNCSNLMSVDIPNSVTSIGAWAFMWCYSLSDVYFENTDGWYLEGICIEAEDIADSETAAEYLTDTYPNYIWTNDSVISGDIDGIDGVSADDAIYLLYNVFFGDESYPISQSCDFDGDGDITANDAIYLLYHVFFGDETYPLN